MAPKLLVAFVFASITLCAQSKEEVALNNLAVSLMNNGDYKEALAHLDKLTAADEDNFVYRYNRAVTLFNLKKYQEAIDEYKISMSCCRNKANMYFKSETPTNNSTV